MEPRSECVVGVDFGTSAVRAVVVDVRDGREIAAASYAYPSGEDGVLTAIGDPNVARQSPSDYVEGFVGAVRSAVAEARLQEGVDADSVLGIGVSATASTPLPVDAHGVPLAFRGDLSHRLEAQAWLWKDHSSFAEAEEITELAKKRGVYLDRCGGSYSSEWYWSKILRCQRQAPDVAAAAASWVELCDFIPAYFTENRAPDRTFRSVCAAGHKGMFHESWGGAPEESFLKELDPELVRHREAFEKVRPMNQRAGGLLAELADEIGLRPGIPFAVGGIDAHLGAVGAGVRPGSMVKILGTSSCDIVVVPESEGTGTFPGTCGVVPGSVLPGLLGVEAGQPAVGDLFNWFVSSVLGAKDKGETHIQLTNDAGQMRPGQSGLLGLDWNNGNRSVLADVQLSGLLLGQSLSTTPAAIYRTLIESSAMGARTIIEAIVSGGGQIDEVIACGGIAEKNDLVMQIYANVCNRTMKTTRSGEACALGAAIYAASVSGAHESVEAAQQAMTAAGSRVFRPDAGAVRVYDELYSLYRRVHDAFGRNTAVELGDVMRSLSAIRAKAAA